MKSSVFCFEGAFRTCRYERIRDLVDASMAEQERDNKFPSRFWLLKRLLEKWDASWTNVDYCCADPQRHGVAWLRRMRLGKQSNAVGIRACGGRTKHPLEQERHVACNGS